PVVGDWTGTGTAKIGVVRPQANGSAIWALDSNGDGTFDTGDAVFNFGLNSDRFVIGKWAPPGPLVAADGLLNDSLAAPLSPAALQADVPLAAAAWAAAGLDAASLARLRRVSVQITDLPGGDLGLSSGDT